MGNSKEYNRQYYLKYRKKAPLTRSKFKEVGLSKVLENGKNIVFLYRHCKYDQEGWADERIFKPLAFDLCLLKTQVKNINGWWDGKKWFSTRLIPPMKVTHWKKNQFDM